MEDYYIRIKSEQVLSNYGDLTGGKQHKMCYFGKQFSVFLEAFGLMY